jgi:hypothetical protein
LFTKDSTMHDHAGTDVGRGAPDDRAGGGLRRMGGLRLSAREEEIELAVQMDEAEQH